MSNAKIIALRIWCPNLEREVSIPRKDYAIGPLSAERRHYKIRCRCKRIHTVPCKSTQPPQLVRETKQ